LEASGYFVCVMMCQLEQSLQTVVRLCS